MDDANINMCNQVVLLSQQCGGYNRMSCTFFDIRNYKRGLKEQTREYDASLLIEHFEQQKKLNNDFFYSTSLDEDGKLVHCF